MTEAARRFSTASALVVLLSLTAGYVDTAGFLALQGLFTSHVTGNFVTIGASLISGSSGALVKVLALPTFCLVIIATRWVSHGLQSRGWPTFGILLGLKVLLLAVAAVLAIHFGPFSNGNSGAALATGLTLVSAMAIQNALQRIDASAALSNSPPTTVMTLATTQLMIDVADLALNLPADKRLAARARLGRISTSVLAFASGCGIAALFYARIGIYCFLIPPLLASVTLVLGASERESR